MIALSHLTIGYAGSRRHGASVVASGLCAEALPGRLTCLMGRNGSGKSTLLRTVARSLPPLAGTVEVEGRSVDSYTAAQYARTVSVVLTVRPQGSNITVEELVALGRTPYTGFWGALGAADRRAVAEAMQLTGTVPLARRAVATLSDGERQKVMVAKALAQQTPVMLLDEPTAFLDFPSKVELMLLLRRLARTQHKTVLLSTHDLEVALQTADDLWLLSSGKLTTGTPRQLAASGAVQRYIARPDVTLDADTMQWRIEEGRGKP